MPMVWATMSCNSLAIRSRSAVTAWAAAWARTCSAWTRDWCIESPMSQAITAVRATISSVVVPIPHPLSTRTARKPASVKSAMETATTPVRRGRAAAMKYSVRSTARNCSNGIAPTLSALVAEMEPASIRARVHSGRRCITTQPPSVRAVPSARSVQPSHLALLSSAVR